MTGLESTVEESMGSRETRRDKNTTKREQRSRNHCNNRVVQNAGESTSNNVQRGTRSQVQMKQTDVKG